MTLVQKDIHLFREACMILNKTYDNIRENAVQIAAQCPNHSLFVEVVEEGCDWELYASIGADKDVIVSIYEHEWAKAHIHNKPKPKGFFNTLFG